MVQDESLATGGEGSNVNITALATTHNKQFYNGICHWPSQVHPTLSYSLRMSILDIEALSCSSVSRRSFSFLFPLFWTNSYNLLSPFSKLDLARKRTSNRDHSLFSTKILATSTFERRFDSSFFCFKGFFEDFYLVALLIFGGETVSR